MEASPGRKGSCIACFKNHDTQAENLFESVFSTGLSPQLPSMLNYYIVLIRERPKPKLGMDHNPRSHCKSDESPKCTKHHYFLTINSSALNSTCVLLAVRTPNRTAVPRFPQQIPRTRTIPNNLVARTHISPS